jgi:DNA transformation protein
MALDERLIAWVGEAMAPLGTIAKRAMMGGATLYCDGTIFALIGSQGSLWFKADAESDATWDAAGCERFSYTFDDGRTGTMNYRRAPDDVYDDAEAFREWASLALAAGHRAPKKAKGAPKPRTPRAGSSPRRS